MGLTAEFSGKKFCFFASAALLLCPAGQEAHAETIYALGNPNGNSTPTFSNLYAIDSTTGVATLIGPTGTNLRGLAIDSTGRAYASRAAFDGATVKGLWEVDLSTGAATFVGGTLGMSDMAFDATGTLYGMENRQDGGVNRRFYSIDVTTGVETFLAQSSIGTAGDLGGFTYSVLDDTFYWTPRSTLRSVNPATGIDTLIATISGDGIAQQVNLTASNVVGPLFVVDRKFPNGELYTVDKATGNAILIGSTGIGVHSIAIIPSSDPDDDGILALDDNCPLNANPNQEDGDGDGVGDVCDNCPDIANPDQGETAACIALNEPEDSCRVAQIELVSATLVEGDVTVEEPTVQEVTFTKTDFSSEFDEITPTLRISRGSRRGVFNAGPDSISWAVGTCTAPTSGFETDFNRFLRDHFRFPLPPGVEGNLPGSDTCLRNDTTGESYDVLWHSWTCGDRQSQCTDPNRGGGGFSYTRTNTINVPVATASYSNSVLPEEIDVSALADGEYELCVSASEVLPAPDTVTFDFPQFVSADPISPNLLIARSNTQGVFNAGSDSVSWAVGTCATPTFGFYSDFESLLVNHFRNPLPPGVEGNLPGSDTCLRNNTTGESYDVLWHNWTCGNSPRCTDPNAGGGGFSYTRIHTVTLNFVTFTKPDFAAELEADTIQPELRIARNFTQGVFNAGTDLVEWAVGTCAAPTSDFETDFNRFLQFHFRNPLPPGVEGNLPGSDTCLRNNTTGESYDVLWHNWTCGNSPRCTDPNAGGGGVFLHPNPYRHIELRHVHET